jgi:mono/diheme cytochrome c family protein
MPTTRVVATLFWAVFVLAGMTQSPVSAVGEPVDFAKEIAPILERNCIRCHVPGNEKGDLSLATFADLAENEYVVPGDPDSSYLVDLITAVDDEPPEMPKDATPLPEEQVALIRRWIAEGADWPDDAILRERSKADASWWSLQPLRTTPDSPDGPASIDAFIDAKLADQGLARNPPADRRTLIRRATYDLTGLPPSPEEVEAFVNDPNPHAYEQLIDRLLASPHYGERWGRHWLDVVRFGESNGFERNVLINNLWPFRDYVIGSINEDKPFDQFMREHLAGDVIGKDDPDVAVGSAFLVAGPYDDVGNQDPAQAAQIRANTLDEMIGATSQAFLGLTVSCARCHDHKFDPIKQEDYYSLYATFAGVRHGAVPLATAETKAERESQLKPLNKKKAKLEEAQRTLKRQVLKRAIERIAQYEACWTRPAVNRMGTEERFEPVSAKFVRLVCESLDTNPAGTRGFRIDEFEIWSDADEPVNVALLSNGAKAYGEARRIEDFPGAYSPKNAIDGKAGAQFISNGADLTIELAKPTRINRVVFSSGRDAEIAEHGTFTFVGEYRIEVSDDRQKWQEVAHGRDRKPVGLGEGKLAHRDHRLLQLEITGAERAEQARLARDLAAVQRSIAGVPALPSVWIGSRSAADAKGPFHVFLGGSPQKPGAQVTPASLSVFGDKENEAVSTLPRYELAADAAEADRRRALADWIVCPDNPLTPRVLANRLWHYHFGTGIVDTPSDFGYMGGRPSHPELLDFLAGKLIENDWRLKPMHRIIMNSQTYRQSSAFQEQAARQDGDARLLWRFPPRRLSAEEIRDTMLVWTEKLKVGDSSDISQDDHAESLVPDGGPGFRLYHFMQDNVCTYVPLDEHGPETYRRAVYHQNARASVVDLMTEFDQPDCAFSTPRRAETTTPLQALTMLNHQFTLDMAGFLAERLRREAADDPQAQIRRAYQLCFARVPTEEESAACVEFAQTHGLPALCRVVLNTSEAIYVQ